MSTSSSKWGVRRGLVLSVGLLAIFGVLASPGTGDETTPAESVSAKLPEADNVKPAEQPAAVAVKRDEQARIEAALKDPTEFQFDQTPLNEVMEYLAHTHQFRLYLDSNALEDISLAADVPVSLSMSGISLTSALNLMLEPLQLTYLVEDEVLKITTVDRANGRFEVRVYDVRDLKGSGYTTDLLTDVIMTSIPRASWKRDKETEGGTVVSLTDGLVITQSQPMHREIAKVLQMLEQHAKGRTPSNPAPATFSIPSQQPSNNAR